MNVEKRKALIARLKERPSAIRSGPPALEERFALNHIRFMGFALGKKTSLLSNATNRFAKEGKSPSLLPYNHKTQDRQIRTKWDKKKGHTISNSNARSKESLQPTLNGIPKKFETLAKIR